MAKKTKWTHKKRSRTIYPNGHDVFQGECVLAEKLGEDGETLYLVKYEGYGLDEAKWVPESCAGPGLLADWAEEKELLNSESVDGGSTQDDEGVENAERGDEENEDEEEGSPSETEGLGNTSFEVNEVDCVIAEHPTEYSHLLLRLPDPATGKRGKPFWAADDNIPDHLIEEWETMKRARAQLLPEGMRLGDDGSWSEVGKLFFAAVLGDESNILIVWPKEKGSLWISPEHWAAAIKPGGLPYRDFSQGEPSFDDFRIVFPDGDDEGTTLAQVKRREAAAEQAHITDDSTSGEVAPNEQDPSEEGSMGGTTNDTHMETDGDEFWRETDGEKFGSEAFDAHPDGKDDELLDELLSLPDLTTDDVAGDDVFDPPGVTGYESPDYLNEPRPMPTFQEILERDLELASGTRDDGSPVAEWLRGVDEYLPENVFKE